MASSSAQVFEAFFLRADVDRDGRVSGAEALNFFRAADLPQPTLALVWEFANEGQTGFLSRQEFYNALKLATVAQTGRELTPELVKAALTGPAAAQIPPPRITPTPPPPTSNFELGTSAPQISQPTPLQANYAQHFSPQSGVAPDLGPQGSVFPASLRLPAHEGSVATMHHLQADRVASVGSVPWAGAAWSSLPTSSGPSEKQLPRSVSLISVDSGPQQSSSGGSSKVNAFQNASDLAPNAPRAANAPNFPGRTQLIRLVNPGPPKSSSNPELHGFREFSRTNSRVGDMAANCNSRPVSASSAGSVGLSQAKTSNPGIHGYDGCQPGAPAPAPNSPWPKMTPSDAQRYVHVFSQVDTDHDGKVTGEQARQLFLSWQLPREVLRHVWDLSDEDCDSMLSVREFCTAVYLLEKFTEGWPVPSRLPMGIHLDEPPIPVSKVFGTESLGSGENSWRLPQGSLPRTDSVFEPGLSSAPECYALSTTLGRHLQEPLSSGEVALEPASCVSHDSQTPHANTRFIKQKRESGEALTPTLPESDKLVTIQVGELSKHMMSQKEKAVYYRSKLQEIVLFKSQCGNKLAEMTEKAIIFKHEVNVLNQQFHEKSKSASDVETQIAVEVAMRKRIQEKKRDLSHALQRLDSEITVSDSHLQTQLDHTAVDLYKLRKILIERAKSLGVEIKRELPKKTPFGWQPNIQEKAAEWKNGWDTFNDDGFTEVQEYTSPTPKASLLAISSGEVSPAASDKVVGENALELDIFNSCRLHREPSQEHSSVLESSAWSSTASSVSITTTGASMEKSTHIPTCIKKPRSTHETSIDNAVHIHSRTVPMSTFAAEVLTRDDADTHPRMVVESAIETLTTAGVNNFVINVAPSKSYSGAESSSEVGSSITSDVFGRNETSWKTGQNDDNAESALQSAWELQSNSRSIQTPAEIKASNSRAIRSRGSFEPEDYFDLSPPRDLSMPSPSSGSSAMASEKTTNNTSPDDHDKFETFGFLAYTLKESSESSPIFTTSTTQHVDIPGIPVLTDHCPDGYLREESIDFDESGSEVASSIVLGMTNFYRSLSPRPGTIKDVHHQFKTNQKAQGTGPGTYDNFWNVYIYGTRFNPELDDTPGSTTYSPKFPSNMPKYSIARRLITPHYDVNPPPPKYRLYPIYHIRSSVLVGEICSMQLEQTRECEACQHFIRIYQQQYRRISMVKKLDAQMKYPSKPRRIPVFKLKLEDAREERRHV